MSQIINDMGNGVTLRFEDCAYRFDPARVVAGEVNLVSHAHSDHVPSALGKAPVVSSPATNALLRLRSKNAMRCDAESVTMKEAGHVPGSRMFVVENDMRILYTGDFCTRRKRHIAPAVPLNCDVLVMETTYGRPGYEFPDHDDTIGAIRNWVEDVLGGGSNAVLLAYPLGKAQELCFELMDFPLYMQSGVMEINRALARHGFRLPTDDWDGICDRRRPFVYITSGLGVEHKKVEEMVADGARAASFSGWSVKRFGVRRENRKTESFPLSDHCDYNELMEFVRLCAPSKVLTMHGFAEEFARSVRHELDIEAEPLIRGQGTLDGFI